MRGLRFFRSHSKQRLVSSSDFSRESDSEHFLLEGDHFLACFPEKDTKVMIIQQRGKVLWKPLKLHDIPNIALKFVGGKNKTFFGGKNIFFCLIFNNKTSCLGHFQGLMTSCIAVPNEAETSEKKQKKLE